MMSMESDTPLDITPSETRVGHSRNDNINKRNRRDFYATGSSKNPRSFEEKLIPRPNDVQSGGLPGAQFRARF
jgi:hypothetical protein